MSIRVEDADLSLLLKVALDARIFPDDWEFETVFGISRSEIAEFEDDLLKGYASDSQDAAFIRGAIIRNLVGYPHGATAYICSTYGISI